MPIPKRPGKAAADTKKAPWKKSNPQKSKSTKLTPEQIQEARTRAAKAGRRYPNLIDNMYVAKKAKAEKRD